MTLSPDAAIERAVAAVRPEMKSPPINSQCSANFWSYLRASLTAPNRQVKRLTWVLTALTAFLVIEAVVRYFSY